MRKLIALLWSSVSVGSGLLGELPSVLSLSYPRLAMAQVIASEDFVLGLLAGVAGVWKGMRARSGWAILLGLVGIALGARRLVRREVANEALSDAMRDGLGPGWQREIPPEVHRQFGQSHRADLWGPVRALPRLRVRETRDVLFAAPGGYPLRLDIYQPKEAAGNRPAVIVIHGGIWFQSDKSLYGFGLHNRWLAAQGYVVFDIQYRLAGRWPAPLADVKCAVRWVKANAARYGADSMRIALLGRSIGGYLALMAAYTANQPDYPAGCFEKSAIDESVQAVIAAAPPTDLQMWLAEQGSAIEQLLLGQTQAVSAIDDEATPVAHVRPGLPPTLIIHGERDRIVPPAHSEILSNRLQAEGVPSVRLSVPWARHGVDAFLIGLTAPMILYDIDRFLAWAFHRHTE